MPFDSNGNYSLPAGYLGVTGELIIPAQHNPPLEDIAAALSGLLLRSGVAPMTGSIKAVPGSVSSPGLQFTTAPGSGIYKTTDGWGIAVGGVQIAEFKSGGIIVPKNITFKDGGDIASANALTLGDGNLFNITGSTTINSIATKGIGTVVWLRFAGTLTLTHSASDLILQSVANITTAPGDWALFEEYAEGDWRMIAYHKASGAALRASLPRGYIDGCILLNGTDATNDINIAAGVCRDSTNAVDITVSAMSGKQLDANWAAGAGAGMRNSGAGIADTTYHIYAVAKADGTQDIYAHTSVTVATVLTALQAESGGSGYIYARRLGSILRESSSIVGFVQTGDYFARKATANDAHASNPGTSAVSRALSVPDGIRVNARVNAALIETGGATVRYGLLTDLSCNDETPGNNISNFVSSVVTGGGVSRSFTTLDVLTNTSRQIRSRIDNSDAAVALRITTLGWWDTRGKDS